MAKFNYNMIAIGAGSGGLVSTFIASAVKAKVALIEKNKMGGDCLNTGCVPSKALISSAKAVQMLKKHTLYGLKNVSYEVDIALTMERVQEIITKLEPHDSVARYSSLGVECHIGKAMIRSPHEVEVNGQVLTTKNIVVATGARPFVPPTPGLEDVQFSHSGNIWDLRKQPKHLAVIGGGPIGSELAQAFSRLGSEVTIFNLDRGILPREDSDMVQFIRESFENDGIKLLDETTIERIEKRGNSSRIHYSREDEKHFLDVDHILMAVGRTPNSSGFGLENLGAELNKNKTIKVDKFLRSSIPNIYACGDVAGPYQFTHMAGHQAWYATVNALFSPLKKFAVDYSAVPWCTYTDPELARVGLSEDEAKARNIPHEVTTYGLEDLDRAITDRTDFGKVKVITPPGKDKILGAAICGVHAGDLLAEFTLAMKHGIGLNKILGTIHPYPTLSEASKMLAGVWRKNHAPAIVLHLLERFHSWRR
ncbi:MAG: FAD-dependent oxidoreductase [SAR324 cluster bacterium]|nr:FAD-dependent oxidoreductase [SAR324 cluster bacterium]